jgi:hypothetical protein
MAFPNIRRSDFSHSLVHLTRDRHEYVWDQITLQQMLARVVPAFEVLKEILVSGTIRGSGNEGYVKGNRAAVCLSEIPLSALREFADAPYVEPKHKYRMYGIMLSKEAVFKVGGRPVIYLPDAEGDWIPAEQKWRHVRFEHGQVDFTHEREWRVAGDLLDLTQFPGLYVLVCSTREAKEIAKFKTPVGDKILGVLPMEHITTMA